MSEHYFYSIIEQLPIGYANLEVVLDANGFPSDFIVTESNLALEKILDRPRVAMQGKRLSEIFPSFRMGDNQLTGTLEKIVQAGGVEVFTQQVQSTRNWYKVTVYSPEPQSIVALFSDITPAVNALEDLDAFFNVTTDLMAICGLDGRFIRVNPAWETVMGYKDQEMVGRHFQEYVHPDDLKADLDAMDELKADKKVQNYINRYRHQDGTYRNLQWTSIKDGENVYAVARDVTESLKKQQQIEYLSFHDTLTGLYNRRFMEEEIKRLNTTRNLPISIVIGDLNRLKMINDAFGHEKGDELICKAAAAIVKGCRADDLVARWGGDEYTIFLPRTTTAEAENIVSRIQEFCREESVNTIDVSISFGIATRNTADEELSVTMRMAEDAMYVRKAIESKNARRDILGAITRTLYNR